MEMWTEISEPATRSTHESIRVRSKVARRAIVEHLTFFNLWLNTGNGFPQFDLQCYFNFQNQMKHCLFSPGAAQEFQLSFAISSRF